MFRNGFTQAHANITALAGIALILLVPLAIWAERSDHMIWNDRLALPSFQESVNRHTPRTTDGTYLPPTIFRSRTITKAESPIHIAGTVSIPNNTTITLDSGVEVFFHEYGRLDVSGTLIVNGTDEAPVLFQTNEEHISNKLWSGITFLSGGSGNIRHATIRHASPAITCESDSYVSFNYTTIELGNLGVFTETPNCIFSNSLIQYVNTGIIAKTSSFTIPTTTTIRAKNEKIQILLENFLPAKN